MKGQRMDRNPSIFATPAWLNARLGDPSVGIVDASWYLPTMNRDGKAEYLAAHIPGAVHFDIDAVKDDASPLPHMLPPPAVFAAAVGAMGLSEAMTLVIYDGAGLFAAPRVRWTFKVMGAKDVRLLDGGFPAWQAAGYRIASGPPTPTPRVFRPAFDASAVADLAAVKAALGGRDTQVVDARPAARFRGEAPEPRPGVAAGHMPGSYNLPFDQIVKDGALVAPEAVKAAFTAAGADLARPVITSCGSGVSAAILSLALETTGAEAKALYDGSWAEWGTRDDCPIAKG
jgi:thiosulfate/3-mercaptopyruvate sulfurtransferase